MNLLEFPLLLGPFAPRAAWRWMAFALPCLLVAASATAAAPDFNREVKPILARNCYSCHGPDDEDRQAGLRLDVREAAIAAADSGGVAIVPGNVDESGIIQRISTEHAEERMPPPESGNRVTPAQLEVLKKWIAAGAPYAKHWSYVPPVRSELPTVKDAAWPKSPIDHFILARAEAAGLAPNPRADKHTLIRRLSLDLRGLPPSPEEIEAFVRDESPKAYERLVERFLNDPAYGERWARMWLDLARYADSRGYGSDPLRVIWRYRDWTIDAFNDNLPYDQFTVEQLAGDLLPSPKVQQLMATAFHRNTMTNTEGGTDDEEFRVAAVKDRVDTTFQVWMGLTAGCAKCHNHKYDPISHAEYYQLFAFFNQSADSDRGDEFPTIDAPTPALVLARQAADEKIASLKAAYEAAPIPTEERAAWEATRAGQPIWLPLEIQAVRSQNGTEFIAQEDGSVLATGATPDQDTYTVELTGPLDEISALQLEVLPDPSLPRQGVGRAADGNFVLSRFAARAVPTAGARTIEGRYVRIELPGKGKILSLAEVQVVVDGLNVAVNGLASQSSTDYDGPAELAIDNNTDGNYEVKSTTHTASEERPWWEVDLGYMHAIERITVFGRTDGGHGPRLAGFKVVVLDEERSVIWEQSSSAHPSPRLDLAPDADTLVFTKAIADHEQKGFPVQNVLGQKDLAESGWAVQPKPTVPHTAIFILKQPFAAAGKKLVITLDQKFKQPGYTLGRFRLLATSGRNVIPRFGMPTEILAIIDKPFDQRTEAERLQYDAYYRDLSPALEPLRKELRQAEKDRPSYPVLPVMQELATDKRRKTHIFTKGNFLAPGEEVSAVLPAAFHAPPSDGAADRLQLARWIVDRNNPLTARVAVNRFWAQLFGIGIVETEEDFGTQGDLPTHPELLDWLAIEFMDRGWDVKQLLREIVTSETYCQSSHVSPDGARIDPRNRLLARGARFRLEAEMVRDQALAIAGLLSRKMHGPSVFPPQPDGLWQAAFNGERTWKTSEGEDRYRRGLYVFWRRTIPYPSLATFDAPSREWCSIRRIRTNTPLQAFVTLNDPVYVEAAQALARRVIKNGGETTAAKAQFALSLVLGRPATAEEIAEVVALYESELAHYKQDTVAASKLATDPLGPLPGGIEPADGAAWTVVANVLLNLDAVLMKG